MFTVEVICIALLLPPHSVSKSTSLQSKEPPPTYQRLALLLPILIQVFDFLCFLELIHGKRRVQGLELRPYPQSELQSCGSALPVHHTAPLPDHQPNLWVPEHNGSPKITLWSAPTRTEQNDQKKESMCINRRCSEKPKKTPSKLTAL